MKVLSLTHAHLNPEGLSPVSCERTDSITGTWAGRLGWEVYVIHTKGTKWRGIWPGGKGLKINIIEAEAPARLMQHEAPLFASALKDHLSKKELLPAAALVSNRITHRTRVALAEQGLALSADMANAEKWGEVLSAVPAISGKQYDFLFVCVGYGDEYLLQTAHVLSRRLHVPLIVDFRDLWSEHHDPGRFTEKQKKQIHRHEIKLLANAAMVSVPQKHMKVLLDKWVGKPVYILSHSAHIDSSWVDGHVVSDVFTMLYAGKLYASGPGIKMLLEVLKQLAQSNPAKPFLCRFFVDDTAALQKLADSYGVARYVEINGWVAPGELWKNLRSAHLLHIPDSGVAENYPILPTKTFQYATTGRQILALLQYPNDELTEFLTEHKAGMATTDVQAAVAWIATLMNDETLYKIMPPLRKMPSREEMATAFGYELEKIIARK